MATFKSFVPLLTLVLLVTGGYFGSVETLKKVEGGGVACSCDCCVDCGCCGCSCDCAPPLGITTEAKVDRVVDGDTLDVIVSQKIRVRLLDCWAPEVTGKEKELGIKSKDYLEKLLQGETVVVSIPTGEAKSLGDLMSFGRVLADVYVDGESVAGIMVEDGYATKEKKKR